MNFGFVFTAWDVLSKTHRDCYDVIRDAKTEDEARATMYWKHGDLIDIIEVETFGDE